jgi:hypothetical protein
MRTRFATLLLAVASPILPMTASAYPPPSFIAKSRVPDVAFEAVVSTFGERWIVTADLLSEASVEINWALQHSGHLKGTFLIDDQQVATAAAAAQFASLPESIYPERGVTLDSPHLRISLSVNCARHTVQIDDPSGVEDRKKVERFMAVWNAIFQQLPVHPTWR